MTKRIIILGLIALVSSAALNAQVGINNTDPKASLDVKVGNNPVAPEGIIAPRMSGNELQNRDDLYKVPQNDVLVYVTEACTAPDGKTANVTARGYYYYDADATNPNGTPGLWKTVSGSTAAGQWFYMQMFNLPIACPSGQPVWYYTFDLYNEYYKQFGGYNSSTVAGGYVTSPGATGLPFINDPNQIEYYVTSYSADVITLDEDQSFPGSGPIDADGTLHYHVTDATVVPEGAFINIIFRIKP